MKVTITIQDTSNGGVFVKVDPGVPQLMQQQLAGEGSSAHAYALAAYRAVHDVAMREAAASGRQVEIGEMPEGMH